ncbi:MAG TPA: phage portal protein [Edaphobacter sp.]|nr:phage portal protein [Edaphobacter sp.]
MKIQTLGLSPPEKRSTQSNPISAANWHFLERGGYSEAGVSVDPHSALGLATFSSCIDLIAGSIASMPLKLYERVGSSKKESFGHPIHDLLAFAPNIESSPKRLWHEFYTACLLHGTAYIEITKNPATGLANGLWFHDSRNVRAYRNAQGDLLFDITVGTARRTLPDSSIIRVAAFASGDGITGKSAVSYARGVLGEAIAQDKFGQRIYGNYATPSGVITLPAGMKTKPEDKLAMRNDWRALQGSNNQGSIAVLDQGMDYKPISFSPEDASWIKSRQLSREFVCGLFHVSTQLVSSEARVSGETYAAQMLSFYQLALKPLMIDLQQQLLQKLFPGQMSKYLIKHDWHSLLEADPATMINSLALIRNSSALTTNEVRHLANLEPLEDPATGNLVLAQVNLCDISRLVDAGPPVSNEKIKPIGNADNE